jgi:hypothetical protein
VFMVIRHPVGIEGSCRCRGNAVQAEFLRRVTSIIGYIPGVNMGSSATVPQCAPVHPRFGGRLPSCCPTIIPSDYLSTIHITPNTYTYTYTRQQLSCCSCHCSLATELCPSSCFQPCLPRHQNISPLFLATHLECFSVCVSGVASVTHVKVPRKSFQNLIICLLIGHHTNTLDSRDLAERASQREVNIACEKCISYAQSRQLESMNK